MLNSKSYQEINDKYFHVIKAKLKNHDKTAKILLLDWLENDSCNLNYSDKSGKTILDYVTEQFVNQDYHFINRLFKEEMIIEEKIDTASIAIKQDNESKHIQSATTSISDNKAEMEVDWDSEADSDWEQEIEQMSSPISDNLDKDIQVLSPRKDNHDEIINIYKYCHFLMELALTIQHYLLENSKEIHPNTIQFIHLLLKYQSNLLKHNLTMFPNKKALIENTIKILDFKNKDSNLYSQDLKNIYSSDEFKKAFWNNNMIFFRQFFMMQQLFTIEVDELALLCYAACLNEDLLKMLIANGVSIHTKNEKNETILIKLVNQLGNFTNEQISKGLYNAIQCGAKTVAYHPQQAIAVWYLKKEKMFIILNKDEPEFFWQQPHWKARYIGNTHLTSADLEDRTEQFIEYIDQKDSLTILFHGMMFLPPPPSPKKIDIQSKRRLVYLPTLHYEYDPFPVVTKENYSIVKDFFSDPYFDKNIITTEVVSFLPTLSR